MKNQQIEKELSAARTTFASTLFDRGVAAEKAETLDSLPPELAELHRNGSLHIHDLDGWRLVNNCSTPCPERVFHPEMLQCKSAAGRIAELFEQYRNMITTVGHRQSGGIGCGNFDAEMGGALVAAGVEPTSENEEAYAEQTRLFFTWLSTQKLRYARENFYVTLNFGLDTSPWGRIVTRSSIGVFAELPLEYTRPNLVFKVKNDVNGLPDSPNYDLFLDACACTAKKMIPTYLLLDAAPNRACSPTEINIMGCRTRVYANRKGPEGSIGRGNVAAISLNLPRMALEAKDITDFYKLLDRRMAAARDILLLRREAVRNSQFLAEIAGDGTWKANNAVELLDQGTYSIGFIGLSETVEILGGGRLHFDESARTLAMEIMQHMRGNTDSYGDATGLNFSLLASAGEGISGRFPKCDAERFPEATCHRKGFYTNSFHVPVDAGVGVFEKLAVEGPFHALANGGSISYVELQEAPLANFECVADIVRFAAEQGVSYLGVNYPLDVCVCGHHGTFDSCPVCGSRDVLRIRRVSGYLEVLNEFSTGKKAEEAKRRANALASQRESICTDGVS